MKRQKGFISERDFLYFVAVIVAIGIAIGVFISVGIPLLWGFIKPFLHTVTA